MNAQCYWAVIATLIVTACGAPADERRPAVEPTRVLASVGDVLITQADVDLSLGRAGATQADLTPIPERIVMAAVDIIASQRQALETLKKSNKIASDAAIDQWLVDNSPPDLKLTADQALTARASAAHVTKANYRAFLTFRLTWQSYLQNTLTDKNLEKHFANQKSRFDGTRFHIEHLWIAAPPGKSDQRTAAHKRIREVRQRILSDQLDFEAAGKELAGDEGQKMAAAQWITGSGPLMPAIVDRVVQTPVDTISEPFDSAQAVHLVRVIAIEPGARLLEEAKEEVRSHMLLYLLDFLAKPAAKEMPLVWHPN